MNKRITRIMMILILSSIFIVDLSAQATSNEITDKFFSLYSKDPIKAVDYAFSTNKYYERKQDDLSNLKNKLRNLIDLCGDYYGYYKLSEKTAGKDYSVITYLIKYDREPIRFTFTLYKAKDNWKVTNFSYDENIGEELEEAAKVYRLEENK